MDIFRNHLEEIDRDISALLKRASDELSKMPIGHLKSYTKNGRQYYSQEHQRNGERIRRGINREPEIISQLARKEFLSLMQAAAEKDVQLLRKLMTKYQSLDPKDLRETMSKASLSLPEEMAISGWVLTQNDPDRARALKMEEHRRWALEEYEQSTFKPEQKIHLTTPGIYVRSKSEALIVEKLYDYSAPNRYEQVILLEGKRFAPDFTFMDAQGEYFYWEHAGMMAQPGYVRNHVYKMGVYERNGIVPWKNLILTYDMEDGAINTALIDSIVRFQVLPRL